MKQILDIYDNIIENTSLKQYTTYNYIINVEYKWHDNWFHIVEYICLLY